MREVPVRHLPHFYSLDRVPNMHIPGQVCGPFDAGNGSARTKEENSCHHDKYNAADNEHMCRMPVRLQFHICTSSSP